MKAWQKSVLEIVQLGGAVLVYVALPDGLKNIVPSVPIIGDSLTALISALLVFVISWLLSPCSKVSVTVQDYATNAAVSGPKIDLTCTSHQIAVEKYALHISHEARGGLAKLIARSASKRGWEVSFELVTDRLTVHSESTNADEERLDNGVVITLPDEPSENTWGYVDISLDSGDVPARLEVDVKTKLTHPNGEKWYDFWIRSTCNVNQIVVKQRPQ